MKKDEMTQRKEEEKKSGLVNGTADLIPLYYTCHRGAQTGIMYGDRRDREDAKNERKKVWAARICR